MVVKSVTSNYKKDTLEFLERDTLTERMRRVRALNAAPSSIGITQYTWKGFAISGCARRKRAKKR